MTARFSRGELLWLPVVLGALAVIYLPGLGNLPVFDDTLLSEGGLLEDYRSFGELRTRMLSYGSFVWVDALFGGGWWKQRLLNLALHVAVVLGLWGLYREWLRSVAPTEPEPGTVALELHRSPAIGAAVGFFALNPVAVYAVAYLIQRSILMATLFVVLGLWTFARGLRLRDSRLHALAFAFYVLAVLSKEHAVLAPLAGVPVYILVARPSARRLAIGFAAGAVAVALAAYVLARQYGEIIGKPFDEFSHVYLAQLAQLNPDAPANAYLLSIVNEAYLFFHYGLRWLIPATAWMSINLRPPFPLTPWTLPHVFGVIGYLALLAGGFILLLRYRDWRALLGLSLLVPAVLFATEFITVWVQDPFVLYRSYLWAIGVPGLVFLLLHGLPGRVLLGVGLVIATLLSWQALDRVLSLATPHKAWTDAILKLPGDPRAVGRWFPYLNRGSEHVDRDQFNLALRDFEASSSLGDQGLGAFNAGSVLSATGRHREALEYFGRAEKQGYNMFNLPFQRGLALLALGRVPEAYAQFDLAREENPPPPSRELVLLHLGRTALQLGKVPESIPPLERLIQLEPHNKEGRYYLGMAYVQRGEFERALALLDGLVRDDPNGRSYYARALAHHGLKRRTEALADIENAIRLDRSNPALRQWEARIRAMP